MVPFSTNHQGLVDSVRKRAGELLEKAGKPASQLSGLDRLEYVAGEQMIGYFTSVPFGAAR